MCHGTCLDFIRRSLASGDIAGRRVLEVGSFDVNGSPRPLVEAHKPASYLGIDIVDGPGVDKICPAERIVEEFGPDSFDVIISTEMMEHVRDWRLILSNMKRSLAPDGLLVVTTRSFGFPQHDYPADYWRYELSDMRILFGDLTIERLDADDPASPGVFIVARKPQQFDELDLIGHALYSMVCGDRVTTAQEAAKRVAVRGQVEGLQSLLSAMRQTRTFRYSPRLRRTYDLIRSPHVVKPIDRRGQPGRTSELSS
jgi:SAM-dependent methyltransferase